MKIHPTFYFRQVFLKLLVMATITFTGCDGKFYSVEELKLPQQPLHVQAGIQSTLDWSKQKENTAEKQKPLVIANSIVTSDKAASYCNH